MSHEITAHDRPMYGRNRPAWHGLGTVIPGYASAAEAQRIAALDWRVDTEPAFVSVPGGFAEAPGAMLTVRSDLVGPERVLGIVGDRYSPIQNRDLFEFLDTLAGEGGAQIDTAGSLKGGRLVWALAKLPNAMKIGADVVERYLLVSTSHDGSAAMQATITPIRVVCYNTLSAALRDSASTARSQMHKAKAGQPIAPNRITIRHTSAARERIKTAQRVLGNASASFERCAEVFGHWARKPVSRPYVSAFLRAIVPDPRGSASSSRAENTRREIAELYRFRQIGADQPELRGTAYGLYNALTQYIDRERTTRANGRSIAEARLDSTWYGSGAALRQQGANLLLETLDTYADYDGNSPLDLVDEPSRTTGAAVLDAMMN